MMNGMGSMTLTAWLGALLVGVALIAAAMALVRLVSPKAIASGASGVVLTIVAVIGVLALLGAGGMLVMHWGMGGMMGSR
jgi:hypothetical protein